MARRKADCSELHQTISDIALALGMNPGMNVDKIVAEMKKKLPWINRDMVTESIVAANRTVQEEQTEIAKQLSAVKHEARVSEQTKKKIDEYEAAVKEKAILEGRKKKDATSTVELLRAAREALASDYRRGLTMKEKRLDQSIAKAEERIADIESGTDIAPVKLSEVEKYPELKDKIEKKIGLQKEIQQSTPRKKKRLKRAMELLTRDIEALQDGTYKPRVKKDEAAQYPELADLVAARDALRDQKNEILRNEAAKQRIGETIARYQQHLRDGTIPEPKPKITPSEEVAALREIRDELAAELRASSTAKGQRLKESVEYLRQKVELLESDKYVAPVKESELEQYPEHSRAIMERNRLRNEANAMIRAKKPLTWGQAAGEVGNFPRAIMSSIDNSAVGRQGGIALATHPKVVGKRIPASFKALKFWGEKSDPGEMFVYEAMAEIDNRPSRPMMYAGGLEITEPDNAKGLGKREEEQASRMMDWLKYGNKRTKQLQKPIDASQRAYVVYMNLIRADLFDLFSQTWLSNPDAMTIEEAKVIANYINVITGRGDLGKGKLASSAEGLNALIWAPRFLVSRFQYLTFQPLWRARKHKEMRKAIAKEYARYGAGMAAFYAITGLLVGEGLEAILGEDDEWFGITFDPRSSDFGKLRFGNLRVDPLAGLGQVMVVSSRNVVGQTKSTNTGEVSALRDNLNLRDVERFFGSNKPKMKVGFGRDTQAKTDIRFVRTKLNPAVGEVWSWFDNQKNVVGQDVTIWTTIKNLSFPLTPREMVETMVEEGIPKGVANGITNFMGLGSQAYGRVPGEPAKSSSTVLRPLN